MLECSNKYLIVFDKKEQKDRYVDYISNSAKISFNALDQFEKTDSSKIMQCENTECKVILHVKDLDWLWSKEQYKKNYERFQKAFRLPQSVFGTNFTSDIRVWVCRFCGKHQLVNVKIAVFMNKPLRFPYIAKKQHIKNDQPLILFLIDWSSSMQQLILSDEDMSKKNGSRQDIEKSKKEFEFKNKTLVQLFKGSILAQKLKSIEQNLYEKAKKLQENTPMKKQHYMNICKNHLLLSIIERALTQIKETLRDGKDQIQRKIGFIFFNDCIFVSGDCTSENVHIVSNCNDPFSHDILRFYQSGKKQNQNKIEEADYDSFEKMVKVGESKSDLYNSSMAKFDVKKMKLEGIVPEGKTALGPALALALGIASKHGEGSNIVIITDGLANKGILSSENSNQNSTQDNIKIIRDWLNKYKCKLGILQWIEKSNKKENPLDILAQQQSVLVTKYEVNLQTNEDKVQFYCKNIVDFAFGQRINNEIINIKFRSNVKFISFSRSSKQSYRPHQQKEYSELVSSKSALWMDIVIQQTNIDPFYLLKNPIYTQLILTMKNIDNGQIQCYVSEIEQFLTKNKSNTLDKIDYDLTKQRIERYQVEGNSFKFNLKEMDHVNNSIRIGSVSQRGRDMDLSMSEDSMYNKAAEYNLSFKSRLGDEDW